MTEPEPLYGDYYREIYAKGMFMDERPTMPISWQALERAAEEKLDDRARGNVFGGAGVGETMRANRAAFDRRRIVPRVLRDVSSRDLSTTILGTELPAPLLLAPIGIQTICHPEGEPATARAAATLGLPMTISSASDTPMEEIAEAGGEDGRFWYQLYWPNEPELAESLVRRGEALGAKAIVVTVDNFLPGWKPSDLQHAYLPALEGVGIAQYLSDPVFRASLEKPPEEDLGAAIGRFAAVFANAELTWDDLESLREWTSLPIVLKGILHPDDALEAAERGVDGIVVSNHGGRQIDGAIGSLDALGPIADAVGDRLTVLADSGIRSGADVFKALAVGAEAVMLGRPFLWGLALEGEAGVEAVLRGILAELDLTMALSGVTTVDQIDRAALAPEK